MNRIKLRAEVIETVGGRELALWATNFRNYAAIAINGITVTENHITHLNHFKSILCKILFSGYNKTLSWKYEILIFN